METQRYLRLIRTELANMPDFVKKYNLNTQHSLTTTYQYLTELRRFFDWLRSENYDQAKKNVDLDYHTLEHLRRSDVMLYIDYLQHSKNQQGHLNSPTTINRSINALRSFFKYMTITSEGQDGKPYFEHNVMLKIKSLNNTQTLNYRAHILESHMYTGERKFDFLNFIQDRYEKEATNRQSIPAFRLNKERDLAIIALILGTGIRVSECAGVNLKDLNLKEATLDVIRKGGQRDSVPIAEWSLDYLVQYLDVRNKRYNSADKDQALFLTIWHGQVRRMTPSAIEKMVSKYSAAFGHPLTPHKLRHTLASELYGVTKDQVLVAQQLGQKGTTATDLYTHVDQKKQRQALNKISDKQ